MHFIAGTIQEARVDEHYPLGRLGNAGLQVDCGASLFVHNAHFQGIRWQAQQRLDGGEQAIGKGHFFGAMHLGLDDINTALTAVGVGVTIQIVHGTQYGEDGIQDALGHFGAVAVQDRLVGHQMPDVADKQ